MCEFVKTVDLKSLWKNQPVKEGQATDAVFFKWLGFNIFSERFRKAPMNFLVHRGKRILILQLIQLKGNYEQV